MLQFSDYVKNSRENINNNDLDTAYEELRWIVLAERIRRRSRDEIVDSFFKA